MERAEAKLESVPNLPEGEYLNDMKQAQKLFDMSEKAKGLQYKIWLKLNNFVNIY